jgi:hypothetical protein
VVPAELGPGSIAPATASGANVTDVLARGLPFKVTVPETGATR